MLDGDTEIGGPESRFPETRHSALIRIRDEEEQAQRAPAYEIVIAAYWKPVYRYIRLRWHTTNEDGKDLTQDFFSSALEENWFRGFDQGKGTFRTYLRTCLDRFLVNQYRFSSRQKRSAPSVPLDDVLGDTLQSPGPSQEEVFQRECARTLFSDAIDQLRATLRPLPFAVFEKYDLADPAERLSYQQIAEELNIPATTVTNHLALARRELRTLLLNRLRGMTGDENELRREMRELFHQ